jgi:hypothetical protein
MRPWFIMTSAVIVALSIASAIIGSVHYPKSGLSGGKLSGGNVVINYESATVRKQTTVDEQGGIKVHQAGPDLGAKSGGGGNPSPSPWSDLGCIAVLTAPKSMQVDDIANVETTLLVAAGGEAIKTLLQAAKDTQAAIDTGTRSTAVETETGLDPASKDALQRMINGNADRQAAVDTLPGSPIMTVHLVGPGFEIGPVTPERQAMTGKQPGHWQWFIKAQNPGPRTLTVSYSAEVEVEGQRVPQALRTLSREVTVNVGVPGLLKQAEETGKVAKSIAETASWFWTTLIFPALMFLYGLRKWLKERRAPSAPASA